MNTQIPKNTQNEYILQLRKKSALFGVTSLFILKFDFFSFGGSMRLRLFIGASLHKEFESAY